MITKERITEDLQSVPMLSQAVVKLIPLLRDHRAGAGHFADAIRPDAGLTIEVLRLASSPAYGGRPIGDVRRAAAVLGTRTLFEVTTSAALSQVVPDQLPGYGLAARDFWAHSAGTAVFAESLGRELGHPTPDLTYTCALLHDVGKLVIGHYLAEHLPDVLSELENGDAPLIEIEREVLGCDHADVGASVAQMWNLPEELVEGIRHHHEPDAAAPGTMQAMADLVHVADALSHMFGYGCDVGGLRRSIQPAAAERLGLSAEHVDVVAAKSVPDIEERVEAFFNAA